MNETLIYPLADALSVAMHVMEDGRVRAADLRRMNIGGWAFDAEIVVVSDVMGKTSAGYFVKLVNNLWAYAVVTERPGTLVDMMVYVFDANMLGLKVKDAAAFGGQSIQATIGKLQPAIASVYEFGAKDQRWTKHDVSDLESAPQEQGT